MYIHDYLVKRDLKATAQAFQAEGKVSSDPVGKNALFLLQNNPLLQANLVLGNFPMFNLWREMQ